MRHIAEMDTCPCGSGRAYSRCCGPVHANGAGLGATAESLMRARYSAYVLEHGEFIRASWHPSTRPASVEFSTDLEWHGLEVVASDRGGALDSHGAVEFRARFERGGQRLELHEYSTFERVDGHWLYVDGIDPDTRT
jgi:SEC-C motif-containing protein